MHLNDKEYLQHTGCGCNVHIKLSVNEEVTGFLLYKKIIPR